ncbi:MAG TPA: DUF429 domain-containing protein [Actinomycetota bacterium]|nr:DUF429 domain-containing protein [Actinomycetota bacterium]
MRSLGIDVGDDRKGYDLVLLDEDLLPRARHRGVGTEQLAALLRALRPDVVAIDSPPAWARDGAGSRRTEEEIAALGIRCFRTPPGSVGRDHPFYGWMRNGMRAFAVADREGYPRYRGGDARGTAIEVFPHATAVVLAGCLPPRRVNKRAWRAEVLRMAGVAVKELPSLDQVDAALAALTGLHALRGDCFAPGDPREGLIVLPRRAIPARLPRAVLRPDEGAQGWFFRPCGCGDPACHALTRSEFAPGHDAKRKALLWRLAREGREAALELRRRGWELPPDVEELDPGGRR